ncbi:hypothetical protein KY343_06540 [Candidatus Woesearchaeota archaeon]|nr:hypothetical protein [Candidatus Woesearchaeota archaeon]
MTPEKDTAPFDDLSYVPFELITFFHRLEQDKKLSKKRQYKKLEDRVDRYIEHNNAMIGDGQSAAYILNRDEYQEKIRAAYNQFREMKTKRKMCKKVYK